MFSSTLIRHETEVFSVDRKHFENKAFRKLIKHNHVSLLEFTPNTNSKLMTGDLMRALSNFTGVAKTGFYILFDFRAC